VLFPVLVITDGSDLTAVIDAATALRCNIGFGEDDEGTMVVCATGGLWGSFLMGACWTA
jgi:hypothetical protein